MTAPKVENKIDYAPQFLTLNESPPDDATDALIYGESKSGKTWLIGTLGDRTLIIDLENGRGKETIESPMFKRVIGTYHPKYVRIVEDTNAFDIPEFATAYDRTYEILDYAFKNLLDTFDHLVIDNLTAFRRYAILKALDVNKATSKSRTRDDIVEKLNAILPAIQDYGTEMSLVSQFVDQCLSACRKFNKNLFVLSHQRVYLEKPKRADGKPLLNEPPLVTKIRPAVTGQSFPDDITSMFNNVWYTAVYGVGGNAQYKLHLAGDGRFVAGTRHAGLWGDVIPSGLDKSHIKRFPNGPNLLTMLAELKESRIKK